MPYLTRVSEKFDIRADVLGIVDSLNTTRADVTVRVGRLEPLQGQIPLDKAAKGNIN